MASFFRPAFFFNLEIINRIRFIGFFSPNEGNFSKFLWNKFREKVVFIAIFRLIQSIICNQTLIWKFKGLNKTTLNDQSRWRISIFGKWGFATDFWKLKFFFSVFIEKFWNWKNRFFWKNFTRWKKSLTLTFKFG